MNKPSFESMEAALYTIQGAVQFVRDKVGEGQTYDEDAVADLDSALTAICEALDQALSAFTRLPQKRRPA